MSQEKDTSQKSELANNKRKVAKKVLINDILTGTYIKRPGWEPSGILTKYGEIARVNLIGVIVGITEEENNFLIDDGTGNIMIRFFEEDPRLKKFVVGRVVNVIGRPREWNATKYVVPEIIKEIENKKWLEVRNLEIKLQKRTNSIVLPVEDSPEEETIETGPYQKILNVVAILDKGDGADIEDIVKHVNIDNCDQIIKNLVEEGEIFELSPGKVKLLE